MASEGVASDEWLVAKGTGRRRRRELSVSRQFTVRPQLETQIQASTVESPKLKVEPSGKALGERCTTG